MAKRIKDKGLSTSSKAVKQRKQKFAREIAIGSNQTKAAIAAGYSPNSATVTGSQLIADPNVSAAIQEHRAKLLAIDDITDARIKLELGRIALFDPRRLYEEDGVTLKKPGDWDDDTASVVASLDVEELFEGRGSDKVLAGHTKKLRLWDKVSSLEKLARIHGLFERDNRQRKAELSLNVTIHDPVIKVNKEDDDD